MNELSSYLRELKRADEISADDYFDRDFNSELQEAVRRGLEAQLSGDETTREVRELAREIVDGEL